jgi:hypothetical protein
MFKQHLAATHYRIHHQTLIESEATGWVEYEFLKKEIMEGKFKDDTLVLKKGGSDWLHASDLVELKEILAVREALVLLKRKKKTKVWGERLKKIPNLVTGLAASCASIITRRVPAEKGDPQQVPADTEQPSDRSSEVAQGNTRFQQAAPARAYTQSSKAGILSLVKLQHAGEIYLKMVTGRNSAEMDIVQEWSLPSNEIARKLEQAILKDFGDFRGAAPDDMDGYRDSFAFQLEAQLKAAAERMVLKHASKPGSTKALVQQLRKQAVNKDEVKRLIGDGGQRLLVTYFNVNNERTTIDATVVCLNGEFLRVCEVGDVNEIAKSIKLNKLITVREG